MAAASRDAAFFVLAVAAVFFLAACLGQERVNGVLAPQYGYEMDEIDPALAKVK